MGLSNLKILKSHLVAQVRDAKKIFYVKYFSKYYESFSFATLIVKSRRKNSRIAEGLRVLNYNNYIHINYINIVLYTLEKFYDNLLL